MSIDESRIESVQSGAEEGAGVRVVSGGTTYFAHVDGLDPADLERAADEAAAALRGERAEPRPLQAAATHARSRSSSRPEEVPAERKAELLRELDERGRGAGRRDRPVHRLLRRGAARGHGRQLRGAASAATTAPASGSAPRPSPAAATRSRPAPRRSAPTAASSCSKTTPAQIAEQAAAQGADPARRRPGAGRARCRWSSAAASAASSSTR